MDYTAFAVETARREFPVLRTFSITVRCEDHEGGTWDGDDLTFEGVDVEAAETRAIDEAAFWLQRDDSGLVADRVTIELTSADDTIHETIEVEGEDADDVTITEW